MGAWGEVRVDGRGRRMRGGVLLFCTAPAKKRLHHAVSNFAVTFERGSLVPSLAHRCVLFQTRVVRISLTVTCVCIFGCVCAGGWERVNDTPLGIASGAIRQVLVRVQLCGSRAVRWLSLLLHYTVYAPMYRLLSHACTLLAHRNTTPFRLT